MTFIKLDKENFVNTKITNRFNVKYKKSDDSTHLFDNNLDSKSIIYNQPDTLGTFSNTLLGLAENSDTNTKIADFFNYAYNLPDYKVVSSDDLRNYKNEYFTIKNNLSSQNSVNNNNLKKYNFKNSFSIDRTVNKFLPSSFELTKFKTIKDKIYDFYKDDFSKDFYPEIDYGFAIITQ